MHHDQVADKRVTSGSHDYEGSTSLGFANAQHAAKFKERRQIMPKKCDMHEGTMLPPVSSGAEHLESWTLVPNEQGLNEPIDEEGSGGETQHLGQRQKHHSAPHEGSKLLKNQCWQKKMCAFLEPCMPPDVSQTLCKGVCQPHANLKLDPQPEVSPFLLHAASSTACRLGSQ